jgi:CheY-like chemotaxis protein
MLTYLGHTSDKREPLDVSEVCRRFMPMLQAVLASNVVMEIDIPTPGPVVNANENLIQQVLSNLVTNAHEATGEKSGVICIRVKRVSPAEISGELFPIDWQPTDSFYACLEVQDGGTGIAADDIDKLFDPFFSRKFTGRGLGLPLVLGIARGHGGAVGVESKLGQGSVFRVYLPLAADEVLRPPDTTFPSSMVSLPAGENDSPAMENRGITLAKDAPPIPSPNKSGGGTVLLVEDEEMLRNMTKTMLTRLGFAVLSARDGVEALEVFHQHQEEIHIVLCDLTMPRMNGWETLAALRQLKPDIPAILISGCNEAQVMAGDHPEWPVGFLGKPFTRKGLSEAINQALLATKRNAPPAECGGASE